MVRPTDVERWALRVVDQVSRGAPVEDSRVELKADWPPDPYKAARRIAAHANASRGQPIIWLLGVDETNGVVGVSHKDTAQWSQQVFAFFDELSPPFLDVVVPVGASSVVAFLFETDRAPFVVRNDTHGSPGGGPVSLEVPWREGTRTRTARRSELLRMLVPQISLPRLDLLSSHMFLSAKPKTDDFKWHFEAKFYVTPATSDRVVFPKHRTKLICAPSGETLEVPREFFNLGASRGKGGKPTSHTVVGTPHEAIIDGPGVLRIDGHFKAEPTEVSDAIPVTVSLFSSGSEVPVTVEYLLEKGVDPKGPTRWEWKGNRTSA